MKSLLLASTLLLSIGLQSSLAQGCTTLLESIEEGNLEEVSTEFNRLVSYRNPYCDTTGSDLDRIMKRLEVLMVEAGVSKDEALILMKNPYYHGSLAAYENQKLTIGRDGKATGKALPPSYKLPSGDYYIVYLWRKKDYLVFALKDGKVTGSTWWEKGKY